MGIEITIRDLHKEYVKGPERVHVLRGLDLDVPPRSRVAITGVSGAGKSTLLHILGTLDHPSRGEVVFDGDSVFVRPAHELSALRNRRIGFVFQFHHLIDEFNAVENAAIPLMIHGIPRARALDQARGTLERVGLSHRLDHRPTELSGGEQQRVAIARALVTAPDLLLMDEPTGNLDSGTAEEIHELILEVADQAGATLVLVTHNESLAEQMGTRYHMKDGAFAA